MAIIGIGHGLWTPPGEQIAAGFDYPGSVTDSGGSSATTTMLVWNENVSGTTVPAMSTGAMFVWWGIPEAAQAGYWSGLFHVAYRTGWGSAPDASAPRYVGMHPYPASGASVNKWSISANGRDSQTNDLGQEATITQWNRKYVNVGFARVSGGTVNYYYHYDYGTNPSRYIEDTGDTKSDPPSSEISIIQGDARWNMGNERWNGPLSIPDIYFGKANFTTADADAALADPFDSSLSSYLWYTNRYPTSNSDITDKSGNGNDPAWVIGASYNSGNPPPLYQEE